MTGNCSVPQGALGALVRRAPELDEVEIIQVLTIGPAEYVKPEMQGHIRVNSLFISDNVRQAVNEGRGRLHPRDAQRDPSHDAGSQAAEAGRGHGTLLAA